MTYTNLEYTNPEHTIIKCDIDGVPSWVPCVAGNADYTAIMRLLAANEITIHSFQPLAPPPINEVTMRQARLALFQSGLLSQVQATIDEIGGTAAIEWEYATVIQKDSPLVSALSAALGLSQTQVDELFELAHTL